MLVSDRRTPSAFNIAFLPSRVFEYFRRDIRAISRARRTPGHALNADGKLIAIAGWTDLRTTCAPHTMQDLRSTGPRDRAT